MLHSYLMKVQHALLAALFCSMIALLGAESASSPGIAGVWQNSGRFVEFSHEKGMRIVLKSYYGFVYDPYAWIPCAIAEDPASPDFFRLTLRYAGEKKDAPVPAALIGESLFFRFYRKIAPASSASAVPSSSQPEALRSPTGNPLDGFYRAEGNADALRLYRSESVGEFYCFYFIGNDYFRIRYWATDARFKEVDAQFSSASGIPLSVPKFIPIDGVLYTCITSTGRKLRNYESGTFSAEGGFLVFKPSNIVFAGTAAAVLKPLRYTLSPDGTLLALGEPYLTRSKVADLDAEIASHNALRRPGRKPIFGFMNLDFYWDEIERIRNGGRTIE
jgi:hypothetical protein